MPDSMAAAEGEDRARATVVASRIAMVSAQLSATRQVEVATLTFVSDGTAGVTRRATATIAEAVTVISRTAAPALEALVG